MMGADFRIQGDLPSNRPPGGGFTMCFAMFYIMFYHVFSLTSEEPARIRPGDLANPALARVFGQGHGSYVAADDGTELVACAQLGRLAVGGYLVLRRDFAGRSGGGPWPPGGEHGAGGARVPWPGPTAAAAGGAPAPPARHGWLLGLGGGGRGHGGAHGGHGGGARGWPGGGGEHVAAGGVGARLVGGRAVSRASESSESSVGLVSKAVCLQLRPKDVEIYRLKGRGDLKDYAWQGRLEERAARGLKSSIFVSAGRGGGDRGEVGAYLGSFVVA